LTQFPAWKVSFQYAGVGGDKVSGGNARFRGTCANRCTAAGTSFRARFQESGSTMIPDEITLCIAERCPSLYAVVLPASACLHPRGVGAAYACWQPWTYRQPVRGKPEPAATSTAGRMAFL
jgi:hypothetical protein